MKHELITLLIILAILGKINTLYLIRKRLAKKPLVCPIGDDCNKVVESKYSHMFFLKNDTIGLIYYVLLIISAVYFLSVSGGILLLMKIFSGLALLATIYLFYVQARVLKEYCFYCNLAAVINLFIFLIIMTLP